ncbi:unnamed protein product [Dicrocoelium dendriticum]|nr:unnamed protein product [Dicrocoelium dendriticum]
MPMASSVPKLRFLFLVSAFSVVRTTVFVMENDAFNLIVSSFPDAVSQFGPELFHVGGFLVVANPVNACEPIQNISHYPVPDSRSRSRETDVPFIALISRGGCNFDLKVLNVQNARFSGAIVYNNVDYEIFPMSGRDFSTKILIPSVMVDKSAGDRLQSYSLLKTDEKYLVSLTSFYSIPLKYVLLALLILVGTSLLILIGCFISHFCNSWCRARRGRLSYRHLRQLTTKRFTKGRDPYEACSICLEDYEERDKLRLLPCHHGGSWIYLPQSLPREFLMIMTLCSKPVSPRF